MAESMCREIRPMDTRALNALKSGAYSRAVVLPGEDAEERRQLERAYADHFQPATQPEMDAVRELVDLNWRRVRLAQAEAAMVAHAASQADNNVPVPVLDLFREIAAMEIEIRVLNKLLTRLRDELDAKDGRPAELAAGAAPVLDRLLGWKESVADMKPDDVLVEGVRSLHCRVGAMEKSRATLKLLVDASRTARDAARAQASLLDPKVSARLLQERTTLSRAIERQFRILRELRGGVQFEAHVRISEAAARVFHETSRGRPPEPHYGEVAA